MEAQQWTLSRDVIVDGYTQYLQQVRKTQSGWVDLLWQWTITFHSFDYWAEGQEEMEEHYKHVYW